MQEMFQEEKEDKERVLKSLDELKLRVQRMDKEIQSCIAESKSLSLEILKLKSELESVQKALNESKLKLNKFVKGNEFLDSLTTITSNKEKRGLGFEGETSYASRKNQSKTPVIRFISASDQKSQFKQSLLYSQKFSQAKSFKNSSKIVIPQP